MKTVNIIPIIILFLVSVTACQPREQKGNSKVAENNMATSSPVSDSLGLLLDSLKYCYVKNVTDTELLSSYKKPYAEFQKDSIIYHNAVLSFFKSDRSIVDQLLLFDGDTTRCGWVYAINPYSSNIRKWEFNFTSEQGAVVLIHDYLLHFCTEGKEISTSPSTIEYIIKAIKIGELKSWLKKNEGLAMKMLCEKFKQELSPFK